MSAKNEELIAAVFAKRCLWDQQNKHYHNRYIIKKNWNKIAKELNEDALCLKKKWKQLRDTFRTELRKMMSVRSAQPGSDDSDDYGRCSQWTHFKSMMFVKDQIKYRRFAGQLSQKKQIDEDDVSDVDEETTSIDMDLQQCLDESFIIESDTLEMEHVSPQSGKIKLKRHHENIDEEIINIERKKLMLLEQTAQKIINSYDEDMAFFVSLVPYMKQMNPQAKLLCQMEVQRTVYNYTYEMNIQNIKVSPTAQFSEHNN